MIFWIKHSITFEDEINYNFEIILSNYTNYFIFWYKLIGRNFLLNFEFSSKRNMILKKKQNEKWILKHNPFKWILLSAGSSIKFQPKSILLKEYELCICDKNVNLNTLWYSSNRSIY